MGKFVFVLESSLEVKLFFDELFSLHLVASPELYRILSIKVSLVSQGRVQIKSLTSYSVKFASYVVKS